MKVLFASQAERTHVLGMAPLAWALRNAGHDVRVATQPELVGPVVESGLTAVSVGRDHMLPFVLRRIETMRRMEAAPDEGTQFDFAELRRDRIDWNTYRSGYAENVRLWWRVVNEPMLDDLVELCRQWRPDLVVWEPITFAAPIAAQACGAVHARFPFSLDLFAHARETFLKLRSEQPSGEYEDPLAAWLEGHAARHGTEFTESTAFGQFTVDHMPDSLRLKGLSTDREPVRFVPYGGRAVVPDWLRTPPRRPRVCLSLGTSATDRLGGYTVPVQELLHSLADLDIELIATLAPEEQAKLDHVPDNTRLVDYVPLDALMPTCSAIINHGGPGTVFTAARHGVPQLVLPHHTLDAPLLAHRVAEQGSGLSLPAEAVTGERGREMLTRVLSDPSFRESAVRLLREQERTPAPADVVRTLEGRVAQRG